MALLTCERQEAATWSLCRASARRRQRSRRPSFFNKRIPPTIAHAFDETERRLKPASSETAKPELRLVPHFSRTAKLFAVSCASSRDSVPAETLRRLADTCGLENVAALLRPLTRDGEGSSRCRELLVGVGAASMPQRRARLLLSGSLLAGRALARPSAFPGADVELRVGPLHAANAPAVDVLELGKLRIRAQRGDSDDDVDAPSVGDGFRSRSWPQTRVARATPPHPRTLAKLGGTLLFARE